MIYYLTNHLRSAFFWDITRRRVVIVFRRCPETSVIKYHTTPRNTPEERRSHQHRGGSLKSANSANTNDCAESFLNRKHFYIKPRKMLLSGTGRLVMKVHNPPDASNQFNSSLTLHFSKFVYS
jgi:hypothetical protein